jgi:integrase
LVNASGARGNRRYVAKEDVRRKASLRQGDDGSNPLWREHCLDEAAGLSKCFGNVDDERTQQGVYGLAEELFGVGGLPATLSNSERSEAWDLLRRALLEVERRAFAFLHNDFRRGHFDHAFAPEGNAAPFSERATQSLSIAELSERFRAAQSITHPAGEKRIDKREAAHRLIIAFCGDRTPADQITPGDCEQFRNLLATLPSNLRKHFPDERMSLHEIASVARQRKLPVLAQATQEPYLAALRQMFQWAEEQWLVQRSPAAALHAVATLNDAEEEEAGPSFSDEQLAKIFLAPLYRGCVDDGPGYARPGPYVIRGTRFWLPLISLFSGMRLNEICQLDVADIRIHGELPYVAIERGAEKRLKNEHSRRNVPLHSQLVKIGFLRYVDEQRRAGQKKLFSDLKRSSRGYYSERPSRWFNEGFLPSVGAKTAETKFHSLRHTFRDALRRAEAPEEIACALGGWAPGKGISPRYGNRARGYTVSQLAAWIERVSYPKLDLSQLHLASREESNSNRLVRASWYEDAAPPERAEQKN